MGAIDQHPRTKKKNNYDDFDDNLNRCRHKRSVARVRSPDPTNRSESNMETAQCYIRSINSLQPGPSHLVNPAAPLGVEQD